LHCFLFSKLIAEVIAYESKQRQPNPNYNVILIAINVLRADHLSCYGYHRRTTPNIDKLADEAFVFKNAFAQAGYTMPNMMSIITSLYPESHGVFDGFKDKLSSRLYTLAEVLNIYGYKSAWFSILKNPHLDIDVGFGRGYDFKGELGLDFERKEKLLSWILKNKDNPFFLALNTRHTHTPYLPLPEYTDAFKSGKKGTIFDNREDYFKAVFYNILQEINTPGTILNNIYDVKTIARINKLENLSIYDIIFPNTRWQKKLYRIEKFLPPQKQYIVGNIRVKTYNDSIDITNRENLKFLISLYDACILGVDQELIRPIIGTLKDLKIYDKTIIIITADHGESLGEHDILGHGLMFYDQFIHVPLIIKFPSSSKGETINNLAQSVDIMPTVLSYLNIETPSHVQGKSLLPLVTSDAKKSVHNFVYGQTRESAYLRSHRWKLFAPRDGIGKDTFPEDKLYDVLNDPQELTDLSVSRSNMYRELKKHLNEHLNSLAVYIDEQYFFPAYIDKETQERIKDTGYW
jgi:arylsulfatase A-like enzyme